MLGLVSTARRAACTGQFLPSRAVATPLASCTHQGARGVHILRRTSPWVPDAASSSYKPVASARLLSTRRTFQHLAPKPDAPPTTATKPAQTKVPEEEEPTAKEQRKSDWGITKKLLVNVWPKNDWKTRGTVLLGFALLISGKVCIELILEVCKC
jgi:hypothetical protein